MKKKRMLFALVVALMLISGSFPATAGSLFVIPQEAPPFLINPAAPGLDALEAFIQTPATATFAGQGFANLDAGWSSTIVNSTFAVEHGTLSSFLTETLNVNGTPFTVNLYGFTGCSTTVCSSADLTDAYQVSFNSDGVYTGFTPLTADSLTKENTNATPEPVSILLLGTGLVGLSVVRRKQHFGQR